MNRINIVKVIELMERAKVNDSLYMVYWQSDAEHRRLGKGMVVKDEQELIAKGYRASIAGLIAISPEWADAGGIIGDDGQPIMAEESSEEETIGGWLGVSPECAAHILLAIDGHGLDTLAYPVSYRSVKPEHVISALRQLLAEGEETCLDRWTEFDLLNP